MAENNPIPHQTRGCTGDCKLCSMMQRGYCASQIAYNNMQQISSMRETLKALTEKINSMQGDAELVAPTSNTTNSII